MQRLHSERPSGVAFIKIGLPSLRRCFKRLCAWVCVLYSFMCKGRSCLTVPWYIHTITHPIMLKGPNKEGFFMKLSLIVTCTHKRKMNQAFNMLKGHFRLHSIAHHNLASPCYPANHRQGLGDAVHLLLEGFRGTAAWRCLGLNSSASPDSHTFCPPPPLPPCLQVSILQAVYEEHQLWMCVCVFDQMKM